MMQEEEEEIREDWKWVDALTVFTIQPTSIYDTMAYAQETNPIPPEGESVDTSCRPPLPALPPPRESPSPRGRPK